MDDELLAIDNLDGYQFEELVAKIMKKRGYSNVVVTSKSRDEGRDVVIKNGDETILIECKHQKFVGRPVVQKLQGAMAHERAKNKDIEVNGIIVTSGKFSDEAVQYSKEIEDQIEFIDGKKLKKLCAELKIVLLNGKVQIITNNSFKNISIAQAKHMAQSDYSKIYGHKLHELDVDSKVRYLPSCYIRHHVHFDTHTSVGRVDSYSHADCILIDGRTGKSYDDDVTQFFCQPKLLYEEMDKSEEAKKLHYDLTENDVEDCAIHWLREEHTHTVAYYGKNNVRYEKDCVPGAKDIDIKQFVPLYIPEWINTIKIKSQKYNQDFYVYKEDQLFEEDDLRKCKICAIEKDNYEDMSVCLSCGRIVCKKHIKIDYYDKETPICTIHAKAFKLIIQKRYFAKDETLDKYKEWWESRNIFQKAYEDKILFTTIMLVLILFVILLI